MERSRVMGHPLWIVIIGLAAWVSGCEPPPEAARSEQVLSALELDAGKAASAGQGMTGDGDGAPVQPGPPADPPPGIPAEPAPGIPDGAGAQPSGPPGGPPGPGGGAPPPPAGPTVTIRGTVSFADYAGGGIQLDLMDGPNTGPTGKHPKVVQLERLQKPGPFEVKVPKGFGDLYLTAFNDADENGRPDREDPRGDYAGNPLSVGDEDIAGIDLVLKVEQVPPPPEGF